MSLRHWALSTGLLVVGATAGALAPQLFRGAPAFAQNAQAVPQAQNGRYVIVHSPWARADQYLIDTSNGRTWQYVVYPYLNDDPHAWQLLPQLNNDADLVAFERDHGRKFPLTAPATPATPPVK